MVKLTKKKIISEIKKREEEIREKFRIKKLWLFGSYTKNKQKESSDIDLLVEFKRGEKNKLEKEVNLSIYLERIFKKEIELGEKRLLKNNYKNYILNDMLIRAC
jgi:uncharacterized protein